MINSYPEPASPLPWQQGKWFACTIWSTDGGPETDLKHNHVVGKTSQIHLADDLDEQNAAYIIHAANAFPHLVAALEAARDHRSQYREAIHSALAIARGEQP